MTTTTKVWNEFWNILYIWFSQCLKVKKVNEPPKRSGLVLYQIRAIKTWHHNKAKDINSPQTGQVEEESMNNWVGKGLSRTCTTVFWDFVWTDAHLMTASNYTIFSIFHSQNSTLKSAHSQQSRRQWHICGMLYNLLPGLRHTFLLHCSAVARLKLSLPISLPK